MNIHEQSNIVQNSGITCTTPSGETLRVREVWGNNLYQEIKYIREIVDSYQYLAMDTEFPGVVAKPLGEFKTMGQYQYQALRANVNMLDIIQIGFTFFNQQGQLPTIEGELCCWQFNFREFHPSTHMYAQDSLDLLKTSGIDFDMIRKEGVLVKDFAELLMCSGVVLNEDIKWITFHGSYDFGYLLKVLTQQPLPSSETEFFEDLEIYFPSIYDMKYLMKFCSSLHGGLNNLAKLLNVTRFGPCHQAGSDSLLTCTTFIQLFEKHFEEDEKNISNHQGILFGLGTDGNIKFNVKQIDVYNQKVESQYQKIEKFDMSSTRKSQSPPSNVRIFGANAQFHDAQTQNHMVSKYQTNNPQLLFVKS